VDQMLKKILTFTFFLLTGLFSFSLQTNAASTTFTYTNYFSTVHGLASACIPINPDPRILTVSVPDNPYTVYQAGGINSAIDFFPTSNCSGGIVSSKNFSAIDNTGTFNKTYVFDYSDIVAFTPISMRIRLMTNLTGFAPSGYVNFMNDEFDYNQNAPFTVIAYDGFTIYESEFYATIVPYPGDPTRTGFVFDYWKDRNGDVFSFELPPDPSLLSIDLNGNQVLYLYASFSESIEIDLTDFDFFPPILPSDRPIDIILFNTGFYNDAGFVFLYALFIIGSSVLLWFLKVPTLVNVIDDIVITALFMIAGYLPLYVAIIMIMLFIVMIISINKSGGLLNE
jgi:hypothetical protein